MTQLDPLLPEAQVDPEDRPAMEWPSDPWDDTDRTGAVERIRRQTRPVKWLAYTAMSLAIVMIMIAGAVGWWYLGKINPEGDPGQLENFTVAEAETFETLSARLLDEGFVDDVGVWEWYVERNGGLEIVPGFYQLRADDHMGNVLGRLRTPPAQTFTRVTFPEGFTIERMGRRVDTTVERMTEDDFITAASAGSIRPRWLPDDIDSLEGLLFPDTYDVSNAESEEALIDRMVALMERVGGQEEIETKGAALGYTPYEVLIVASMIEREAAIPEDRAKISRVILNRMFVSRFNPDDPFPLQIDAAVLYGRDQVGLDPDTPFSTLRIIDTPWNTYSRAGLPATPIANPGRASIRAALNPAPNPAPGDPVCKVLAPEQRDDCFYFYYVIADEEGGHAFAVTGDQHNSNVERARQLDLL